MKQGDTVFVSATATGLGKDKKAVIDKIENVMGTTFVTVTYTHPDAVSGLGGCFVYIFRSIPVHFPAAY